MLQKRRTNLYKSDSDAPFNISRSKISLFKECQLCFYLDRKIGISRPDTYPLNLNNKVDSSLKAEFDYLREQKKPHSLMQRYKMDDVIPFWHPELHIWRDDIKKMGAFTFHKATNLNIHGMIDDIWINKKNDELYIVDYKATSSNNIISIDSEYREGYRRQIEVYQWIFRQKGFNVSNIGYFLFANANKNFSGFNGKLEFETLIIPYQGDDSWIEPTVLEIKKCLDSSEVPEPSSNCQYCAYRKLINKETLKSQITLI